MGAPRWPPSPPSSGRPGGAVPALDHRLRWGGAAIAYIRPALEHWLVAVDYALWLKREDGGCAVAVEEVGVGEGLERDFLGRALACPARMGLA